MMFQDWGYGTHLDGPHAINLYHINYPMLDDIVVNESLSSTQIWRLNKCCAG